MPVAGPVTEEDMGNRSALSRRPMDDVELAVAVHVGDVEAVAPLAGHRQAAVEGLGAQAVDLRQLLGSEGGVELGDLLVARPALRPASYGAKS